MSHSTFRRIWLPGFLLQSVIIGGGYATGRELVEFFLGSGPAGGLLGMLAATVLFSITSMLCFELARLTRSYDYRSFLQQLLGRGWFTFEWAYFALCLLVLAVVGAAAGELGTAHLGLPRSAGTAILLVLIGALVFCGSAMIEKVLAGWSFLLYFTYALLVAVYLWHFGGDLASSLASVPVAPGWLYNGVRYFGYNVVCVAIILFCVKHMESRRDAVQAGLLAGPLVMIPALLFYLAMAADWPAILDAPVPSDALIQRLNPGGLEILFYLVIFGTFVETGTGFIHAINERIGRVFSERGRLMPRWLRPVIAGGVLAAALGLAGRIGLIDLIAKGYGTLTWVFIVVLVVPVFTIGLWKIATSVAR